MRRRVTMIWLAIVTISRLREFTIRLAFKGHKVGKDAGRRRAKGGARSVTWLVLLAFFSLFVSLSLSLFLPLLLIVSQT